MNEALLHYRRRALPSPQPPTRAEQANPDFVSQVTAMEKRAATLPAAPKLHYMYPVNGGFDANVASQLFALGGDELLRRTMPDCHVGEGGGVACALADFAAMGPQYNISFINAEVSRGERGRGTQFNVAFAAPARGVLHLAQHPSSPADH